MSNLSRLVSRDQKLYPETQVGGFSRVDGGIEFYSRVRALLTPESRVLDFGAGRGRAAEDPVAYRRGLRALRGSVAEVVGVDIDEAVMSNPMVDRAVVVNNSRELPFETESFDLIVADWVFEHLDDPVEVGRELWRILKPGGWICARTPNRWGTTSIGARIVPNRFHVAALRRVQPMRKSFDVFPTRYRLNTPKQLRRAFPPAQFDHFTYTYESHPAYAGGSYIAGRCFQAIGAVTPPPLRRTFMVFLRRRA
jgi:SAM-dependent methyltransferase